MDNKIPGPLQNYSRDELLQLIEQQSFELEDFRAKSEQFEHLYLDIIHSTSWKLSWPIRAMFKLLTRLKKSVSKSRSDRSAAKSSPNIQQTGVDSSGQNRFSFDDRLSDLKYFMNDGAKPRINVLISRRLDISQLEMALSAAATTASKTRLSLRVLTFDPQVTARTCQEIFSHGDHPQSLEFVLHAITPPGNARNTFRLDFGKNEIMVVFSEPALAAVSRIAPASCCFLLNSSDPIWPDTIEVQARQITSRYFA